MKKLTPWDIAYAVNMAIACGISYAIITQLLVHFVDRPADLLGGMWAVISTVFVFRERRVVSLTVGLDRLLATCVSFLLCLVYLLAFPFTLLGLAAVIGTGTVVLTLLGREDNIVTTGITTAVVLGVAALSPNEAWQQPILRLIDTVIGIGVGLSCKWIGSFAFFRIAGQPVR